MYQLIKKNNQKILSVIHKYLNLKCYRIVKTIITHTEINNRFKRLYVVFLIIVIVLGLNLNVNAGTYIGFGRVTSFTNSIIGFGNHTWQYSEKNKDRLTCLKSIFEKKQGRLTYTKSIFEKKQGRCTCTKSIFEKKQGRLTCRITHILQKQGRFA